MKQLLELYSAIPRPAGLLLNFLAGEYKVAKALNGLTKTVPNVDPELNTLFDGFELGLWSGAFIDKKWNLQQKQISAFKDSPYSFQRFHGHFELFPKKWKSLYCNLADDKYDIVPFLKKQIKLAQTFSNADKTVMVLHPGYVDSESQKKRGVQSVIANLSQIAEYAAEHNVYIGLETMYANARWYCVGADPEELLHIIKKVNHSNIQITFDWGHLNTLCAHKKISDNYAYINDAIELLGKHIIHFHLNYNRSCEHAWKPTESLLWNARQKLYKTNKQLTMSNLDVSGTHDQHLPLTRVPKEDSVKYMKNLQTLFEKTSLREFGYITHEVMQEKIYSVINIAREGASANDHRDDIKMVKDAYNKVKSRS